MRGLSNAPISELQIRNVAFHRNLDALRNDFERFLKILVQFLLSLAIREYYLRIEGEISQTRNLQRRSTFY